MVSILRLFEGLLGLHDPETSLLQLRLLVLSELSLLLLLDKYDFLFVTFLFPLNEFLQVFVLRL